MISSYHRSGYLARAVINPRQGTRNQLPTNRRRASGNRSGEVHGGEGRGHDHADEILAHVLCSMARGAPSV